MFKQILVLLFLVTRLHIIDAQDVKSYERELTSKKRVQPLFWIYLEKDTTKISTRLFEAKDSSLVISKSSLVKNYYEGNYETNEINVRLIKTVKYLNTNDITAGMVLCGLAGMLVGVATGTNEEDSPDSWVGSGRSAESKAAEDIFIGAIIGTGIGALVGSFRIYIPLNGKNYSRYKSRLEKESVKKKYLSDH